jgi:hypothetical protein
MERVKIILRGRVHVERGVSAGILFLLLHSSSANVTAETTTGAYH